MLFVEAEILPLTGLIVTAPATFGASKANAAIAEHVKKVSVDFSFTM